MLKLIVMLVVGVVLGVLLGGCMEVASRFTCAPRGMVEECLKEAKYTLEPEVGRLGPYCGQLDTWARAHDWAVGPAVGVKEMSVKVPVGTKPVPESGKEK